MRWQFGVITIALVAGLILVGLEGPRVRRGHIVAPGPIYTVPQVEEGLDHHPASWVGTVVRVRAALVTGTSTCGVTAACLPHPVQLLVADMSESLFAALEVQVGTEESWLRVLERVPLLSALAPRPVVGAMGVYEIRLERVSRSLTCFVGRCYRGVLLGSQAAATS